MESQETDPRYEPNPVHRNRTPGKSQWSIVPADELACFVRSATRGWLGAYQGWGVHLVVERPDWLGTARDHATRVFVAKFVGRIGRPWHGYPADGSRDPKDIPEEWLLAIWLRDGVLGAAKVRKLMRGQLCSP